ncbi:MAG TPA: hypothetical protein VF062_07925 [Candidatus Limnocylindrales bacterium]
MTAGKRITVYVPGDVVENLGNVDNLSAYVTKAVRNQIERDELNTTLRAAGYEITDGGKRRARSILDAARERRRAERAA